MDRTRKSPKVEWTEEDRARHQAIREEFASKPSVEELVGSGKYEEDGTPPASTVIRLDENTYVGTMVVLDPPEPIKKRTTRRMD